MQLDLKALGEHIADLIADVAEPLRKEVATLVMRIDELEGRPIPKGEDGKSVTVDDVAPMITEQVRFAVEAIPAAQGGKDADSEVIRELVAEVVAQIPVPEDGKDAEPVLVADVVAELVKTDVLAPVLDLYVAEAVAKHFEENPVQHGKDGKDVTAEMVAKTVAGYLAENPPPKGDPGRDGLDVKDLFRADGGHLVAVMSDGTTKDLGKFVGKDGDRGKDGDHGKDGLGFEHFEAEYDGERTLVHRYRLGDEVKEYRFEIPVPIYQGVYTETRGYKKGDVVTWGGSQWTAMRADPEGKPGTSDHWRLSVKRGERGAKGEVLTLPATYKIEGKS